MPDDAPICEICGLQFLGFHNGHIAKTANENTQALAQIRKRWHSIIGSDLPSLVPHATTEDSQCFSSPQAAVRVLRTHVNTFIRRPFTRRTTHNSVSGELEAFNLSVLSELAASFAALPELPGIFVFINRSTNVATWVRPLSFGGALRSRSASTATIQKCGGADIFDSAYLAATTRFYGGGLRVLAAHGSRIHA